MLLGIVVSGTVVVVCCFVRLVDHNAESAASVDAVVNVAGAIGYGITAISARYLSAEQITFAGGAILLLYFVIRAVLYGITSGTEEALVLYGVSIFQGVWYMYRHGRDLRGMLVWMYSVGRALFYRAQGFNRLLNN